MKLPIGMAALVVVQVGVTGTAGVPTEPFNPNDSQLEPNRTVDSTGGVTRFLLSRDQVADKLTMVQILPPRVLAYFMLGLAILAIVCCMFQPQGGGPNNMRLPPRWELNMENTLPFISWTQDLMLWTICTDMNPPQQCAAIISQLGGAARELARSLTPNEVFNGGQRAVARCQWSLQPCCCCVHVVSAEQFQTLTQPFGLRLPATEAELAQMSHHLRRLGHIVERYPNNIASGLRSHMGAHYSQAFLAQPDGPEEPSSMEQPWALSQCSSCFLGCNSGTTAGLGIHDLFPRS